LSEKSIPNLIKTALGEMEPDFVVKEAHIFDSFTGFFRVSDLAVKDGRVAGIGSYDSSMTIDGKNHYLLPGFVDGHVHMESSFCCPGEFARCLNSHGVTTVIADPHEIANVAGIEGIKYFLRATENVPADIYFMLPSCVPATPLETGGATLAAGDLAQFVSHPRVLGLGEMMNYPGVLSLDPEVMKKLELANNQKLPGGKRFFLDGHAPGLIGRELTAYAASGISSDHEATKGGELSEKLSSGLFMLLREGSAAKNLLNLLPAVTSFSSRFCGLATDDRHAIDLKVDGSVNHLVRIALGTGLIGLPELINMATLNAARHYGLPGVGALAPGYKADFALYSDLWSFRPVMVWKDGVKTSERGKSLIPELGPGDWRNLGDTVKLGDIREEDLKARAGSDAMARVIGMREQEIITDDLTLELPVRGDELLADPERNISKFAVFDRYRGDRKPAVGFLRGLGLRRGALASTVSHDSHNLVVAGASDKDMLVAAKRAAELRGGLVAVLDRKVLGELPLPVGGIMSVLSLDDTASRLTTLRDCLPALGFQEGADPFMSLAFMSLPVIPHLKLTSRGLVDVNSASLVSLSTS
jgi:adenine deaminase